MATATYIALLLIILNLAAGIATNWAKRPSWLGKWALVGLLAALVVAMFIIGQVQEHVHSSLPGNLSAEPTLSATTANNSSSRTATNMTPILERSIEVPADRAANQMGGGVGTGIGLKRGQIVEINASGTAVYGYQGDADGDCSGFAVTTPDGQRTINGNTCGVKRDQTSPFPNAPVGTLIGRVANEPWFLIGSAKTFRADRDGDLWLAYNDVTSIDNQGGYAAIVRVCG